MKTVLVCLHGWGGSSASFAELRAALSNTAHLRIITPDLPGFGETPEPDRAWSVDDYADYVTREIVDPAMSSGGERLLLLGHSHGGRIALMMAHRQSTARGIRPRYPIEHLFLCAAAGIRRKRHLKRIIGLLIAKTGKTILALPILSRLAPLARSLLYKLVRVHDYEKASPIMQGTLIRVSQQDLAPLLSSITIPTDIFWGEDDRMTPFEDGLLMTKLLQQASLHRFPGVRHAVHRDRALDIAESIKQVVGHHHTNA